LKHISFKVSSVRIWLRNKTQEFLRDQQGGRNSAVNKGLKNANTVRKYACFKNSRIVGWE